MTIFARDWIEYHSVTTPDKIAMIDLMSKRRFTYKDPVSYTHLTLPTKA